MLDVRKNIIVFKKRYNYYKERVNTVTYPEYELKRVTQHEKDQYEHLTEEEIIKKIRTKMVKQKYKHSRRVENLTEELNEIMDNNKKFEAASNVSALLHDYGRFMQAVLFNNYKDAEDFFKDNGLSGHGEVGSRILFTNNEIAYFKIPKKYYPILEKVITNHSLPTLGEYNKQIDKRFKKQDMFDDIDLSISCMLQMVKDADTCDILYQRTTDEYPIFSNTFSYNTNGKSIKEISEITGVDINTILAWNKEDSKKIKLPFKDIDPKLLEVPEEIKEKFFKKVYITNPEEWDLRSMQRNTNYNYNSITGMWWSIGQFLGNMNFTASLELIKKQEILEKIYSLYPEKYKYLVQEMFEFAQEELIEKRIKEQKIYAKKI